MAAALVLVPGCSAAAPPPEPQGRSIFEFIPPRHHEAIRAGTSAADLSGYFAAAFEATSVVWVPAGVYPVRSVRIPSDRRLLTAGLETRFRQLPTAGDANPVLEVRGSRVEIGDCTIIGIIELFRPGGSEFNHGLAVKALAGEPPIRDVRIGNIVARNVRGDAVYLHCDKGTLLERVRIASVIGANVLRNGVAIVGGQNIAIGSIETFRCGYASLDIEPEGSYSAPVGGVRVGSVKGAVCAIQANPDTYVRNVEIEILETSPRYSANSSPPYTNAAGKPFDLEGAGLILRNAGEIVIGVHRASDHRDHAVRSIEDARREVAIERSLELGSIDYHSIGYHEQTYRALINATSLEKVSIGGGKAELVSDGQSVVLGSSARPYTRGIVSDLSTNGLVARHLVDSEFRNLRVSTSGNRGVFQSVRNSQVQGSVLEAGYLGYDLNNVLFDNSRFTKASDEGLAIQGRSSRIYLRSSTINGMKLDGEFGGNRPFDELERLARL